MDKQKVLEGLALGRYDIVYNDRTRCFEVFDFKDQADGGFGDGVRIAKITKEALISLIVRFNGPYKIPDFKDEKRGE